MMEETVGLQIQDDDGCSNTEDHSESVKPKGRTNDVASQAEAPPERASDDEANPAEGVMFPSKCLMHVFFMLILNIVQ